MIVLAIETSCDETSCAVVHNGRVLSNVVSSQIALHQEYGGVVPELAAREHLGRIVPICESALCQADVELGDLDAVAATRGPGLPNALQVGFHTAQSLAFSLRKKFIGIHHHEAHLYSPWIQGDPLHVNWTEWRPSVSLIVSGGHTLLVRCTKEGKHEILGATVDDAAGECFDKVAKLLGLPYPGGPWIDRLAADGNPKSRRFPRPMLNDPNYNFSFSGLKTSVRYYLESQSNRLKERQFICDMCAGVQAAIVETLVTKSIRAAREYQMSLITLSGGVGANQGLRSEFHKQCSENQIDFRVAPNSLSGDNAAMVGVLAERRLQKKTNLKHEADLWDQDPRPSWPLSEMSQQTVQMRAQ